MESEPSIFFFDGNCGVCDATVDFLLRNSPSESLHFAPIQSEFALGMLAGHGIDRPDLTTAYLYDGGRVHEKSAAVLGALGLCTGRIRHLSRLRLVPRALRDFGYDLFSRHRHRILKKSDHACRILETSERRRFHG